MIGYLYNLQAQRELSSSQTISFSSLNQEEKLLQYLPALFSSSDETIFVTNLPSKEYISFLQDLGFTPGSFAPIPSSAKQLQSASLELWCLSPSGTFFLPKGSYPHWDIVKKANSKVEALTLWNRPPIGHAITNTQDLLQGLETLGLPCLLKSEFGFAAKGNRLLTPETLPSLEDLFSKSDRFVLEPYLKRLFDFSSQWILSPKNAPHFLGGTICINNAKGRYLSSIALPLSHPFLSSLPFQNHLEVALPALCKLQEWGYFGPVGIDAFAYQDEEGNIQTHPLVEINARKTMGFVALSMQRRHAPHALLQISFEKRKEKGLLPSAENHFNLYASYPPSLPLEVESTLYSLQSTTK